jgi:hypothetical protein
LATCQGELHGTAATPSREQVVLVTVPVVVQPKVAVDSELYRPAPDVKNTRGAPDDGGGGADVTLHE